MGSAAVYLVHPVQTEAVVSIVGRSELLAAALFFTAWLAFRKGRTGWACIAYFLAALAKESAITFPAVAALDIALARLVSGKRCNPGNGSPRWLHAE
jgi:hypothetical protein